MDSNLQPLVSVVTPVYNGDKYLAKTIESVLAQTYQNWEYIIINNCSTDRTLEIAQHYAEQDERIRVDSNKELLPIMSNWNHALRQISPESKYCKVVHADDLLMPECIAAMVGLAEANPSVGIVGAYRINGNRVDLAGIPYPKTVLSGKEVCRSSLLYSGFYVFGSPSSLLLRSDVIRQRQAFYQSHLHADVEACYDVLQDTDFGFVHQILTYTRRHDESQTSAHHGLRTNLLGRLTVLKKYGPVYLSPEEYDRRFEQRLSGYYRFLGQAKLCGKEKSFWDYHENWLKDLGLSVDKRELAKATIRGLVLQWLTALSHPKATVQHVLGVDQERRNPGRI